MMVLAAILNLPWSAVGLVTALLSVPRKLSGHSSPLALVVHIRSFWWCAWLPGYQGARAMVMGNVVLLGPAVEQGDLEHELVHVEQFAREPLIHPFFAFVERMRHGPRYSKYESEAYTRTRSVYRGETKSLAMARAYLGQEVGLVIDRPVGSKHPKHGYIYPVNYGYVPDTQAPDGAELDAYYLGTDQPLKDARGVCIAILHRLNDDDDKLIVVPRGTTMTNEEITAAVRFQEQWFVTGVVR